MGEREYVLAMYDIRGKQKFIFRKGKIQEVIGASKVIEDLFEDYLYPAANSLKHDPTGEIEEKIRRLNSGKTKEELTRSMEERIPDDAIKRYKTDSADDAFTWEKFEEHLKEGYLGEVVYDGGGNFLVIYKNEETCEAINRRFTKRLMEKIPTLKVLCSYVKADWEKDNFREDRKMLYRRNAENEANESVTIPFAALPFTQVDRKTSFPLVGTEEFYGDKEQVSAESQAKLRKYKAWKNSKKEDKEKDELILDELVEEKGVSSLLAIIHIDGNNMGAMFQTALNGLQSYEDCIRELRRLSRVVQDVHIAERKNDIDNLLEELNRREKDTKEKGGGYRRAIVSAGDDFTIICKAQDALEVTKEYLGKLWVDLREDVIDKGRPRQWSSCAGIAIFHSHTPFADAYRIAEECCDSAKKVMKNEGLKNAELIDFEYLQSGIDMSLEKIRQTGGERISSRPWVYRADKKARDTLAESNHAYVWLEPMIDPVKAIENEEEKTEVRNEDVPAQNPFSKPLHEIFQKIGRSNIKGLAVAALDGPARFRLELERMAAHAGEKKDSGERELLNAYKKAAGIRKDKTEGSGQEDLKKADQNGDLDEKAFRELVYDCVIFHDLWFSSKEMPEESEIVKSGRKPSEEEME